MCAAVKHTEGTKPTYSSTVMCCYRIKPQPPSAPAASSSVSQGLASSWPGANTTSVLRLGQRSGRVV